MLHEVESLLSVEDAFPAFSDAGKDPSGESQIMTHASGICLMLRPTCIYQSPTAHFLQNSDKTSEEPTRDPDRGGKTAPIGFIANTGEE